MTTGDDQQAEAPRYENGTVRDEANVNQAVVTEQPAKPKATKAAEADKPEPAKQG